MRSLSEGQQMMPVPLTLKLHIVLPGGGQRKGDVSADHNAAKVGPKGVNGVHNPRLQKRRNKGIHEGHPHRGTPKEERQARYENAKIGATDKHGAVKKGGVA